MLLVRTDRWFFNINPSLKVLVLAALFFVYLFVQNLNTMIWSSLLFMGLFFVVTGCSDKLAFWLVVTTVVLSLLGSTAMVFFGEGKTMLIRWGPVAISEESLARGLLIGMRTFIFTMVGLILSSTTRSVPLFYSLMQQLKLPVRYAYGCLAAFRMLPTMAEEFTHVRQAMKVRGLSRQRGPRAVYERIRRYAMTMLAQSIRRAQRTAVAMEAKRFSLDGSRTFYYEIGWSRYDLYFLAVVAVTVAGGFLLAEWLPPTPFTHVLDG